MSSVRIGVIGLGNIGKHHATYLTEGKVPGCELTAVCSSSNEKRRLFKTARAFEQPAELLSSGSVDAVLIATPHYQHTTIGIEALERGLHILVEKPISAHKADAERLIAAHKKHPDLIFGAMFQFRVEPRYLEIKRLLQNNSLGRILRFNWIMTDWFRTDAYYGSGGWRATWKGEGGGVLLNQCLHNLETLQWLLGMPARLRGFCKFGAHHNIEVEDDVSAWMEFDSRFASATGSPHMQGCTGILVTSTGESPGANRFEIVGTGGTLILEHDRLLHTRNHVDVADFSRSATLAFAKPDSTTVEIPFINAINPHATITANFVNAILKGEPLVAPGAEGLRSVELANVIMHSSLENRTLELPLDSAAYQHSLQALIAGSTFEKRLAKIEGEDISSSFKR